MEHSISDYMTNVYYAEKLDRKRPYLGSQETHTFWLSDDED